MSPNVELEPFAGRSFVAALDSVREQKGQSWRDVARAVSISASTLTRLRQGTTPDLGTFVRLCEWADLKPENYLQVSESAQRRSFEEVSLLLRSDPNLDESQVHLIEAMIKTAYAQHGE